MSFVLVCTHPHPTHPQWLLAEEKPALQDLITAETMHSTELLYSTTTQTPPPLPSQALAASLEPAGAAFLAYVYDDAREGFAVDW